MSAKKTDEKPNNADPVPAPIEGPARLRINRGSTRRIARSMEAFDKACADFIKEIDLQFFEADDAGERVASWKFVDALKGMQKDVIRMVSEQIHPAD